MYACGTEASGGRYQDDRRALSWHWRSPNRLTVVYCPLVSFRCPPDLGGVGVHAALLRIHEDEAAAYALNVEAKE